MPCAPGIQRGIRVKRPEGDADMDQWPTNCRFISILTKKKK